MDTMIDLGQQKIITVEPGYTVNLTTNDGFKISIEVDFELQRGDDRIVVKPGTTKLSDQLRNVLNKVITSSEITAPGDLVLSFDDRTVLRVKPHQTYEAWTLAGPTGEKIVSMPGGELATWSAQ